jgi:hypothetical protein
MTSEEIKKFTEKIRKDKNNRLRIKGSQTNPTRAFSYNGSRSSHYPAMEVDHGRQTDVYEFEKSFAKSKLPELISKWILFSIHAKRKSGDFFLVVDDKSKHEFNKIIADKKLDIQLITI